MNKGYILHFDLQERGVNPLNPHMIFNELDNNTSDFFIVVTSGEKEVDIENADVTLAIIKPNGEAESQSVEIKDNCIYCNLKSYMKNEVGNYVASILLILDDKKVIIDEITYTITEDNVFRLLNDTVKEDERFPILTNMLNELYDIKIKEKQRELNEEQRIENENNRQNIFESKVNEVNSKINEVNKSKNEIVNTFNTLTAQQQQDAEVIAARDGEVSLKARLDRDLEKGKETFIDIEGSYISTDSNEGYLKNVEISGNTIQDISNLDDIKSVGDKVEGQELYKIDIVSCGKNFYNGSINIGKVWNISTAGYKLTNSALMNSAPYNATDVFVVKPNTTFIGHINGKLLQGNIKFYDKNQCYLKDVFALPTTSPTDAHYCTIHYASSLYNDVNNIQLEYGTQVTSYEPYQEDKLTILSPVQIDKVGDAEDKIIEKNGVWGVEKNINTIILNGSEVWGTSIQYESTIRFHTVVPDSSFTEYSTIRSINSMVKTSNILKLTDSSDEEGCATGYSDGRIFIKINKNKLSEPTVEGFKKLLNETPLILKYQTNNPTFIPLPNDQQIKLKSFDEKTTISFLTEIEGTLKAQIPKSIAASINTHTTQIDNLNKELDRVKKLEESKVSTVETESDFTTVEETNNGYFEDIKLEGKTLVNSLKVVGNWFDQETILQTDSTVAVGLSHCLNNIDLSLLKSNTVYTVIPFIEYKVNKKGCLYLQLNTEINGTQNAVFRITEDMFNKPTLITTKELTNKNIKSLFLGGANCSYNFKSIKILMLEGDYTKNSIEYINGLKSVGQDVDNYYIMSSSNGNLIDLSNITEGVYITDSGRLVNHNNSFYYNPYINVYTNVPYYFLYSEGSPQVCRISCYGEGKTFISTTEYISNKPIYFESNVKTIRLSFFNRISIKDKLYFGTNNQYTDSLINLDKKNILYYNKETQTWEKPILREWDTIEKHSDGKYYYHQRSGEIILNGSENWILSDDTLTNTIRFIAGSYLPGQAKVNAMFLCDTLSFDKAWYDKDVEGYTITNSSGHIYIRINRSKLSTQDVEGFKAWLKVNPTTLLYQLAEEKIYECTNIDLLTYENETNYIVESGAITPKTTLKVHNNISNIVRLLQSKVSMLENNMTDYMVTQNRLLLSNRYSTDNVGFTVDTATFSLDDSVPQYDTDLYNLILNNILVGKENYNRDYMESLINFYWMTFAISDEMYFTLSSIIEEQYTEQEDMIMEESPTE